MNDIKRRSFLQMLGSLPAGVTSLKSNLYRENALSSTSNLSITGKNYEIAKRRNYGNWNNERLLRFMIGQHTPDVDQDKDLVEFLGEGSEEEARRKIWSKFNPKQLVALVKNTGAEVFYFYAKCHFGNAYYPSKVGHVHSIMKSRDYFGEIIQECIDADIIPVALYECADLRLKNEKPEWCYKNENGTVGIPCFNSPYSDFVLAQAEEIWSNYDIATLFFDMVDFHGHDNWKCPYCEELYKKDFGSPFTGIAEMSSPERAAYRDWCQKQVAIMLKKLRMLRDKIAPSCGLEHNFHAVVGSDYSHGWKDTRDFTDGYHSDIFAFRDGSVVDIYYPKLYKNALPDRKSFILADTSFAGMADSYDVSTPKPFDFYVTEAASILANDLAFCSSICIEIDGSMDKTQAEVIGRTNTFFKPRLPYLLNTQKVHYAGIIFPGRSRDLAQKENQWRYIQEFTGWVRLLTENQVIFDVIADELFGENLLEQYKIIILPDVEALSDLQIEKIRKFSNNGGIVIATGTTSLIDVNGLERKEFGLKEVLGISLIKPIENNPTYIHLTDEKLIDADKSISPWIYLPDGQVTVQPLEGTRTIAQLARKPKVNLAYLRFDTEFPSITVNKSAFYFAGEPGLAYVRYQYPAIQRLVRRILQPPITESMPVQVETSPSVQVEVATQENPKRLIIHLINHSGNPGWTMMAQKGTSSKMFTTGQPHDMAPVQDITVRINKSFWSDVKNIYLVPGGEQLSFKEENNKIIVRIARIGVHEMVVVE